MIITQYRRNENVTIGIVSFCLFGLLVTTSPASAGLTFKELRLLLIN
jgi:hypothetical protein